MLRRVDVEDGTSCCTQKTNATGNRMQPRLEHRNGHEVPPNTTRIHGALLRTRAVVVSKSTSQAKKPLQNQPTGNRSHQRVSKRRSWTLYLARRRDVQQPQHGCKNSTSRRRTSRNPLKCPTEHAEGLHRHRRGYLFRCYCLHRSETRSRYFCRLVHRLSPRHGAEVVAL